MHWWLAEPMRMIQTNLREIDTDFTVDEYVEKLKAYSANVVLFNVGGIEANYDTDLPFQYRNPYQKPHFVETLFERLHQEGIRVIGRFDFSKINTVIGDRHPDWLYVSPKGEHVNYNGQYHTCVNSAYQQEYSRKIVTEAIRRLHLDGVFFNMIGYKTRDYSGNYYGICQCENCKRRFKEMYGHDLPLVEDPDDPVFRLYDKFRTETSRELFMHIRDTVKQLDPEIAICTYSPFGTDIYRRESNTGFDRPLPEWDYSGTENVRAVLNTWNDKVVSNAAVHFIDFPFRFSAVNPELTKLRLVQDMVNLGWMDFYVIGTLSNQDDRTVLPDVRKLFAYHKDHMDYFRGGKSVADICVILPKDSNIDGSQNEMKGVVRMLSENHFLFDMAYNLVLDDPALGDKLARYKLVVLPDVRSVREAASVLDAYVQKGGKLLLTGASGTMSEKATEPEKPYLRATGVSGIRHVWPKSRGCYFRIQQSDKKDLSGFDDLDIIYLVSMFLDCQIDQTAKGYLRHIPDVMFGPPEKCYYTKMGDAYGLVRNHYGDGDCVWIPWGIGRQYEKLSNHSHSRLLKAVVTDLLGLQTSVETDASPLVEVSLYQQEANHRFVLNLVNHSGQLGTAFHDCLPIYDVSFRIYIPMALSKAKSLTSGRNLSLVKEKQGGYLVKVPRLDLFDQIVLA